MELNIELLKSITGLTIYAGLFGIMCFGVYKFIYSLSDEKIGKII